MAKKTGLHDELRSIEAIMKIRPQAKDVKAAREAAGLTVREAARVIGTSPRAWYQWEEKSRNTKRRIKARDYVLFSLLTLSQKARDALRELNL